MAGNDDVARLALLVNELRAERDRAIGERDDALANLAASEQAATDALQQAADLSPPGHRRRLERTLDERVSSDARSTMDA